MFFVVSKVFTVLLRPLFWVLIASAWAFFTKKNNRRKWLAAMAFLLIFIPSNKVIVNELAILWEPENEEIPSGVRKAVVLGGFADFDEYRRTVTMSEAAERLFKAMEMYRKHQIDTIIISGGAASITGKIRPESIYARQYMINQGIDSSIIFIDTQSINTFENAVHTEKLIRQNGMSRSVVLITTASHMPRAKRCFKKAELDVFPKGVQYFSNPNRGYIFSDYFIPSSEALKKFDALMKEWVGYLVYRISGKA